MWLWRPQSTATASLKRTSVGSTSSKSPCRARIATGVPLARPAPSRRTSRTTAQASLRASRVSDQAAR
ncbi:MAG: hypothetical protein QM765_28590 [Myxococcales bacterium]